MYGIVTFHDGINFGAYLQVYALHKRLLQLGIDNEVINYKNRRHWFNEYKCFLYTKNPVKLVVNIRKLLKFRKAQKKLRQTAFFTSPASAKLPRYDGIFFGSDEIWNFRNPLFGLDPFYFGEGLSAKRFISYAASFGTISADDSLPERVKELLGRFNGISVRDVNSSRIIAANLSNEPALVIDPTLLYDFTGQEIECPYEDFIMVYSTGFTPETQKMIREYAASKGKKLISVGWWNPFCDANEIALGPFEFLGYCKKADEIITSMFHGTLFSIKYRKQFCIFADPYRANKMSVLDTLNLRDRVFTGKESLAALMSRPVDYSAVSRILIEEKQRSESFILSAAQGAHETR